MDATNKETNVRRSIKKFFFEGIADVPIYFDRSFTANAPSDQWISVILQALRPRAVSIMSMPIYLNTTNDIEGDKLSMLRDKVVELLEPGRLDLFDTFQTPWVKVNGIQLVIESQSRLRFGPDQSKTCWIMTTLRWGAKW